MSRSFYQQLAAVLWLAALLARLLLRDRVPYVAALVYATPPLILGVGALAVAGSWAWARRRRWALAFLALGLACGAWHAGVSRRRQPEAKGDLRVLLWNVSRGQAGWDRLAADIEAPSADLVFLVEADGGRPGLLAGTWRWIDAGLAVGGRGTILSAEIVPLGPGSRAVVVKIDLRGRPVSAILVDVGANPLRPRGLAFGPLDVLRRRVKPDLILGDFNTPRDSVHFDAWRGELAHGFEAAGEGWDATWNFVLCIDHVWCAPSLRPVHVRHVWRPTSDHAQVVAEVLTN
jgi:vancomycin resistance protein VanJ